MPLLLNTSTTNLRSMPELLSLVLVEKNNEKFRRYVVSARP
jgi:hypothetical protein